MDTLIIDESTTGIGIDTEADEQDATPSTEEEVDALWDKVNPDRLDIDPDDYEDDTAYLEAIPGMVDALRASMRLPYSAFKEWK